MRKLLSVSNMRKSDKYTIRTSVPSAVLMYRAGVGIKLALENYDLLRNSFCFIVCGTGNNAGDGYVLASLLKKDNIPVAVCLTSDKFSEDGKYYYNVCVDNQIPIVQYPKFSISALNPFEYFDDNKGRIVIVDCLLGTGFKGTPRQPFDAVIEEINEVRRRYPNNVVTVCADINSGLNGDSGMGEVIVKSDLTITIGDLKPGIFLNKGKDVVGDVVNADIGISPQEKPFYLVESADVRECLPKRLNDSNKGTYGYICLMGGSFKYSGASALATKAGENIVGALSDNANAAMRQGAGVVMLAAPKTVCPLIIPKIQESTVYPLSDNEGEVIFVKEEIDALIKRVRVIAFGMGIGNTEETGKILTYLLENYTGVLVIDADGLNALAGMDTKVLAESKCRRIVLTPHLKEFERLTGNTIEDIRNNPIELAKSYANDNNVIVLLKGPSTVVTNGKDILITDKGCPGMATAGSGDVLSGIMAAICGYNTDYEIVHEGGENDDMEHMLLAVASAAYINGLAGELAQEEYGEISMVAGDTVASIYKAIKEILC